MRKGSTHLEALQDIVVDGDLVQGDIVVPIAVHPLEVLVHGVEPRLVAPVMWAGRTVSPLRVGNSLRKSRCS